MARTPVGIGTAPSGDVAGVRSHTELEVWKLCDELREMVGPMLDRPTFRRDPYLQDQLNRAVESPCPNIAEGFSRYYPRDNARFVRVAKGSLSETIERIGRAVRKGMISEQEAADAQSLARRARKAAINYIIYLENCDPPGGPPPSYRRRR